MLWIAFVSTQHISYVPIHRDIMFGLSHTSGLKPFLGKHIHGHVCIFFYYIQMWGPFEFNSWIYKRVFRFTPHSASPLRVSYCIGVCHVSIYVIMWTCSSKNGILQPSGIYSSSLFQNSPLLLEYWIVPTFIIILPKGGYNVCTIGVTEVAIS